MNAFIVIDTFFFLNLFITRIELEPKNLPGNIILPARLTCKLFVYIGTIRGSYTTPSNSFNGPFFFSIAKVQFLRVR